MKQIKNLVCSLLLSVCGATMFTACSEDNEVVDAKDLELSKSELVFLAEPGEAQTVTFTANADWKATSEQGWILIDTPVGKKGESVVSVSVKQNPEKVSRQGNVIITEPSTGKMASFKVTQEAEGVNFAVSKEVGELAIDNENKMISDRISVTANFDYDIQIKDVDWVTYSIDEATKDIIFYADNEKVTTGAKDIVVNFVPEEENVEAKSWTLKWNGFTPSVKFYKDEACTQEIDESGILLEESMNGFQAKFFVKSNIPWTFETELENTILSKVSNSENGATLERVFETVTTLFAVFNEDKLSNIEQSINLGFKYNSDESTLKIIKEATTNFVEINSEDFNVIKDNDPNGQYILPMFDAINETGNTLSLEFRVKTFFNTTELTPVFMEYDNNFQLCKQIVELSGLTCTSISSDDNSGLKEHKYRISVPDRSNDEGQDRYFMLFIVPNYDKDRFLADYFMEINTPYMKGYMFNEDYRTLIGNVKFGQYAYMSGFTFEPVGNWNNKVYAVEETQGDITISFKTDLDLYNGDLYLTVNAELSEDGKYIINEDEFYGNEYVGFPEPSDIDGGYSLKFNYNLDKQEAFTMYIGGRLGDKIQYLGQFTVKKAAATSTSEL